jgi:hypothetical protein
MMLYLRVCSYHFSCSSANVIRNQQMGSAAATWLLDISATFNVTEFFRLLLWAPPASILLLHGLSPCFPYFCRFRMPASTNRGV